MSHPHKTGEKRYNQNIKKKPIRDHLLLTSKLTFLCECRVTLTRERNEVTVFKNVMLLEK